MIKYIVKTDISIVVEANNEKEAEQKAYNYFSDIILSQADIDLDNEFTVEEY
jgi:hypothetical protein